MKITKQQLKKIIKEELMKETNPDQIGSLGVTVGTDPEDPYREPSEASETIELPPEQHDAWLKLREVLTLIERAGMNVISKGKEEQKYSPVQVVKLVQGIVGAPQTQDSEEKEITRLLRRMLS
jgi:hypothetical protein